MNEYLPSVVENVVSQVDDIMNYRDFLDSMMTEVYAISHASFVYTPPPPRMEENTTLETASSPVSDEAAESDPPAVSPGDDEGDGDAQEPVEEA